MKEQEVKKVKFESIRNMTDVSAYEKHNLDTVLLFCGKSKPGDTTVWWTALENSAAIFATYIAEAAGMNTSTSLSNEFVLGRAVIVRRFPQKQVNELLEKQKMLNYSVLHKDDMRVVLGLNEPLSAAEVGEAKKRICTKTDRIVKALTPISGEIPYFGDIKILGAAFRKAFHTKEALDAMVPPIMQKYADVVAALRLNWHPDGNAKGLLKKKALISTMNEINILSDLMNIFISTGSAKDGALLNGMIEAEKAINRLRKDLTKEYNDMKDE